jgi:ATP-binding cassette subfamily B protein
MAAAERIFHVMDQKTEDFEKGIKKPENPEISTIDFEDVWFAYEKENWVLKGLTFSVKGGEMAALVGMTGAGKTTVTQLLLRFYDFQRGSIKINGVDIRKFSLKTIRSLFSVVLQDPEIFSGTISENISFYRSEISKEKIESAVASVSFKETVSRFSDGVDHFLSERGKSLSAGEKQLLSLARAFANEREAVILDEATANIDSRTEEMIKKGMQALLQEKTSIVIAHRLSTIKKADKIIVLHGGVACEIGTHRELLEKKGVYEKLYRLQYKDI